MSKQFILISIVVLFGCVDKIDFERPVTIQNGIAILGKLTKGNPSRIRVTIRKVFNFNERDRLLNVKLVELIDEQGNEHALSSSREGVYDQTLPNFPIDYGVGYKIRVSTFDNRIFESTLESILPVPTPKQLRGQIEERSRPNAIGGKEYFPVVAFNIDTPIKDSIKETNSRLLWEVTGTYKLTDDSGQICYVNFSPFQNYIPLDGTTSNATSVNNVSVYETIPTAIFAQGFYLSVLQQSLSETAFNYWSQVSIISNRTGDLFEPPVGNISSNFINTSNSEEEVFGYFYATEEKIIRTYISPAVAGYPERSCPCDCSALDASSSKPTWWIE